MTSTKVNAALTAFAAATVVAMTATMGLLTPAAESQAMAKDGWGPQWTADGKLKLPTGYHEWVFLGSPLTPDALNGGEAAFPEYHNVYVQPQAFRAYRATGEWPEGTIMLKELQRVRNGDSADGSSVEVSGRGYFPGARNGIDISVKDSTRFADTDDWGFFNFGHHAPPYPSAVAAAPADACANCHIANADDMVFSKFYKPILDAKESI